MCVLAELQDTVWEWTQPPPCRKSFLARKGYISLWLDSAGLANMSQTLSSKKFQLNWHQMLSLGRSPQACHSPKNPPHAFHSPKKITTGFSPQSILFSMGVTQLSPQSLHRMFLGFTVALFLLHSGSHWVMLVPLQWPSGKLSVSPSQLCDSFWRSSVHGLLFSQ